MRGRMNCSAKIRFLFLPRNNLFHGSWRERRDVSLRQVLRTLRLLKGDAFSVFCQPHLTKYVIFFADS